MAYCPVTGEKRSLKREEKTVHEKLYLDGKESAEGRNGCGTAVLPHKPIMCRAYAAGWPVMII
jgi:hypothetical protein